jgi:glycosyltransferase involved in cell wall biosynthesis
MIDDSTQESSLLFSVVIPTFRRPDTLAKCLSALAPGVQTLPASLYEVIVSDDNPPSESFEASIRRQFPWARWIQGPRKGPAANRNNGARVADGEWLAFTDDDCIPGTDWLKAFAQKSAEPQNERISVLEGRTSPGVERLPALSVAPVNESGGFLWSCNFAIRRALFSEMGGFDENFPFPHLEDVDFRLRLEDAAQQWLFVPCATVVHPPRPVLPVFRQTLLQESSFYLARKRGVPVASVGLSPRSFARGRLTDFSHCKTLSETLSVCTRILTETLLLLRWCVPLWAWRYRLSGGSSNSVGKRAADGAFAASPRTTER